MRARTPVLFMATVALTFAACGGDDDESAAAPAGGAVPPPAAAAVPPAAAPAVAMPRRVEVAMTELAFTPASVDVKRGEIVSFVFTNNGKLQHDAFLGTKAEQDHHEEQMRAMTDPSDHAGHEGGVTVQPGQTGSLRKTFGEPGTFEVGCHEPGHYGAGMKLLINVT